MIREDEADGRFELLARLLGAPKPAQSDVIINTLAGLMKDRP